MNILGTNNLLHVVLSSSQIDESLIQLMLIEKAKFRFKHLMCVHGRITNTVYAVLMKTNSPFTKDRALALIDSFEAVRKRRTGAAVKGVVKAKGVRKLLKSVDRRSVFILYKVQRR